MIEHQVHPRPRYQHRQAREEGTRGEDQLPGALRPRPAQLHRHIAPGRARQPLRGQRRAKDVPADPFEALAVAGWHPDAGVEVRTPPTARDRRRAAPSTSSPSTEAAAQPARSGAASSTGSAAPSSSRP